jgi:serine/threonine protein phosphatase PrpC
VGDSRAYLISDSNMELITRDHSLVRRLQELGRLTSEEAEVHPQRNVLYRALGQGETMDTDAATRRLPPGSRLLLCSDGMWGVVGDERIAAILDEVDSPQEACNLMVEEANARGGPDNITAVLMQMPD